jgi:hypothetical protein
MVIIFLIPLSLKDATMIYHNNTWWILSLFEPQYRVHPDLYKEYLGMIRFLYVMYADSPLGPWYQHPNNCEMTAITGELRYGINLTCVGGPNVKLPHKVSGSRTLRGIRPGGSIFEYKVCQLYSFLNFIRYFIL